MAQGIFYFVVSTIVGAIAYALGLGWQVSLMASLVVPPMLLLLYLIARYKRWV